MFRLLRLFPVFLVLPIWLVGQVVIPTAQSAKLDSLHYQFQLNWKADSARAVDLGFPIVQSNERLTVSFVGFENNRPQYVTHSTLSEVQSYHVDQLWAVPYGVTGSGFTGAIWEAFSGSSALPNANNGNLLTNGVLPSRVSLLNTGTTSSHATNVALRIAGDGNASASTGVGPAKTAKIAAWDVSNVYSEMAASIGSYLVSNHSYAEVHGWTFPITINLGGVTKSINWLSESNVSKTEGFEFGRYGSSDYNLDLLANYASYHCIVKAAGNDRNDNGSALLLPRLIRWMVVQHILLIRTHLRCLYKMVVPMDLIVCPVVLFPRTRLSLARVTTFPGDTVCQQMWLRHPSPIMGQRMMGA